MKINRRSVSKMKFKKTASRNSFRARRRRKAIGKAVLTATFIVLVVSSIYFLVNWPAINISSVEILEDTVTSEREIIGQVTSILKGSYFFIIPFTNTFFYPRSRIESSITESFLRIKGVESKRNGLSKIVLSITERKPKYIWCDDEINTLGTSMPDTNIPGTDMPFGTSMPGSAEPSTESSAELGTSMHDPAGSPAESSTTEENNIQSVSKESCFFMDDSGFVFAPALLFPDNVYITYRGSIFKNPLGEYYMPIESFQKIKNTLDYMDGLNIHPFSVDINYAGVGEIKTSLGGKIIFSSSELMERSLLEVLVSVVGESKIIESMTPQEFFTKIEYLDLRLGNKLFYKLR